MTTQRNIKQRKLPFWKRWLLWLLFAVTSLLTLVFVALTLAMPFLYEVEAESRGVIFYAIGMSLLLAGVCADSARRVYRRLQPR
jgi:ABC-type transport system involved in multi-copper enzyme maturation permease subunit